jgi:hypothetical protein
MKTFSENVFNILVEVVPGGKFFERDAIRTKAIQRMDLKKMRQEDSTCETKG